TISACISRVSFGQTRARFPARRALSGLPYGPSGGSFLMFSQLLTATKRRAPSSGRRDSYLRLRPQVEALENRCVLATSSIAADLVSDQPGVAAIQDPNLLNAWGIATSPTGGAFWVSSNHADRAVLYSGDVGGSAPTKAGLEVAIPGGAPTGDVFNSTSDFVVTSGADSAPALFIFASEAGAVTGWNPGVPLPSPSTSAQTGFTASDGAIYKGIALANNG